MLSTWLITDAARARIEMAVASGIKITDEQQAAHIQAMTERDEEGEHPRIMTVAGDKAEIAVVGMLTRSPDYFMRIYGEGNTTYAEVIAAIALIDSDDSITETTMRFQSPGGNIDGLFDCLAAIADATKPIHAVVEGMCASAAYAMAAKCVSITAASAASHLGSIGVATSIRLNPDIVTLTSTEAPDKRPDVTTEAGKAAVVKFLDSVHDLYVEAIATGRGVSEENINANYGRGAVLLARDALKSGMIDSIAASGSRAVSVPSTSSELSTNTSTEAVTMDLAELKAKHPALYAQVVAAAQAEGSTAGETAERQRVNAHLTLGESHKDMPTALAAIADGSGLTPDLQAKYMAAGQTALVAAALKGDDATAGAGDTADTGDTNGEDATADAQGDAVADAVELALGGFTVEA